MSRAHIAGIAAGSGGIGGDSPQLQVYGAELESDHADVYTGGSMNALKDYVSDMQYGGMDSNSSVMFMGWLDDLGDSNGVTGGGDSDDDSSDESSVSLPDDDLGDDLVDKPTLDSFIGSSEDNGVFVADGIVDEGDKPPLIDYTREKISPLVDF